MTTNETDNLKKLVCDLDGHMGKLLEKLRDERLPLQVSVDLYKARKMTMALRDIVKPES
jgi:hypothetical protein